MLISFSFVKFILIFMSIYAPPGIAFKATIKECDIVFDNIYITASYTICQQQDSHANLSNARGAKLVYKNTEEQQLGWTDGNHCSHESKSCNGSVRCRLFHVNDANTYSINLVFIGENSTLTSRTVEPWYIPNLNSFYCYRDHNASEYSMELVKIESVRVSWEYHSYDVKWRFINKSILQAYHLPDETLVSQKECNCRSEKCTCEVTNLQSCQSYKICLKTVYSQLHPDSIICDNVTTISERPSTPILKYNKTLHAVMIDNATGWKYFFDYKIQVWNSRSVISSETTGQTILPCPTEHQQATMFVKRCNTCECSDETHINCQKFDQGVKDLDRKIFLDHKTNKIWISVVSGSVVIIIVGVVVAVFVRKKRTKKSSEEKTTMPSYDRSIQPRYGPPAHIYESIPDLTNHYCN